MFRQWLVCILLVALAPLLVVADPIPLEQFHGLAEPVTAQMFQDFTLEFGKNYKPEEYTKRLHIFRQNLEKIDQLNRKEKGTATFGITRFADLTYDEFVRNFTGGRLSKKAWKRHEEQMETDLEENIEFVDQDILHQLAKRKSLRGEEEDLVHINGKVYLPKKYDYRKKNAVTPVKNQGDCGSCWAFSTMCNIEGVWAKKKKQLFELSEQELLDCDKKDDACDGGWMMDACEELVRLGGVATSKDYPYKAKEGTCRFEKSMAAVKIAGCKSIPANENKMAKALVQHGPISIAVHVSSGFQFYKNGVYDPTSDECSNKKDEVDHGVAIVGYGVEGKNTKEGKSLPFWIIKNSWSSAWGDKGYMMIARGKNACALTSYVSTATV